MRRFALVAMGLAGAAGCAILIGVDEAPAFDTVEAGTDAPMETGVNSVDASPGDAPPLEDVSAPEDLLDAAAGTAGCKRDAACTRIVFVTSSEYLGYGFAANPNKSSYEIATQRCQALANASAQPRVRGRTFKPWFATNGREPADQLVQSYLPYQRPDGRVIANGWTGLTQGPHQLPIAIDEKGVDRTGSRAWTGTHSDGTSAGANCQNWAVRTAQGRAGEVGFTDAGWTSANSHSCAGSYRLYCFED